MKIQFIIFFLAAALFMVLIDLYTWRGFSKMLSGTGQISINFLKYLFFGLSLVLILWLFMLLLLQKNMAYDAVYRAVLIFAGAFILIYVPKIFFSVFQLLKDLAILAGYVVKSAGGGHLATGNGMKWSSYLLQTGLLVSMLLFISIAYGILFGRYNYRIKHIIVDFPGLPASFDGVRFIQISDFHLGSFAGNKKRVSQAINRINDVKADYLLFTGDMVNNHSSELEQMLPEVSRLQPGIPKFSVLGNHDYGDYHRWNSAGEKIENLERLVRLQEDAGFRVLRNDAVYLERNGDSIGLAGVENWGLPPFPQYGKLQVSLQKVLKSDFKILMSHDPSHWDAEVRGKTDVQLTLSGHTHGMQFAIRLPGFHWSPVSLKYPRWAGLYEEGDQKLYVNIGIGFIGFPGRVGTPPEICLIELKKTEQ